MLKENTAEKKKNIKNDSGGKRTRIGNRGTKNKRVE